jgi:hypothetical protein
MHIYRFSVVLLGVASYAGLGPLVESCEVPVHQDWNAFLDDPQNIESNYCNLENVKNCNDFR